jgi:hypothetical protein
MRGTNVNPLMTMFCLARLIGTVLFCGTLALPATHPRSEGEAVGVLAGCLIGALTGVLIDVCIFRRIDIFGKRE